MLAEEIKSINCNKLTNSNIGFSIKKTSDFFAQSNLPLYPHRHNYFMIFFNKDGYGKHIIDFKEQEITPQSITCMRNYQVHQWTDFKNLKGYIVFFETDFFNLNYQNNQLSEFFFLTYQNPNSVHQIPLRNFTKYFNILKMMELEYKCKFQDYDKTLRFFLNILLIKLNRVFDTVSIHENKQSIQIINQFQRKIDLHFKEKHLLKHYADELKVSASSLNAICKKTLKKSASELIKDRILLEAKRLLLYEEKNISEIAYYLGFEDNSYFTKFFRKYENQTPINFKKSFQELDT